MSAETVLSFSRQRIMKARIRLREMRGAVRSHSAVKFGKLREIELGKQLIILFVRQGETYEDQVRRDAAS
jgi:hypothetical protein